MTGSKRKRDSTDAIDAIKRPRASSDADDAIFDHERSASVEPEIVMVDSDDDAYEPKLTEVDDEIVIDPVSDSEDDDDAPSEHNELQENADFIGFGFSDSEDSDAGNDSSYSDDGVVSGDDVPSHHSKTVSVPYPWIKDHDHSREREIADWLTEEMKDFVNYISPSKEEILARNEVITNLKATIKQFWPACTAHVFGSSATDLYLPGSDIDMVVVSSTGDYEDRSRLYQLSSHLRQRHLAKQIEVIAKAKVPIIKFVDPDSNIHVDVSFERTNGIDAAHKIRHWLDTTPGLREMVLIVKQFLRSRKLNNVHVGGLGGYATIIMCYHFLRMHPKVSTGVMKITDNLGALLIEFFELYGRNFSYDNLIISLDGDVPRYMPKYKRPSLAAGRNPFAIVIQDPSDPDNNITRSSYNLRDLKKAFGGAFQLLTAKCYELNQASYKQRLGQSILGDIIKYRGKERNFHDERDQVENEALIKSVLTPTDSPATSARSTPSPAVEFTAASDDDDLKVVKDAKKKAKKEKKKEKKEKKKAKETESQPRSADDTKAAEKKVMEIMGLEDDDTKEGSRKRRMSDSDSDEAPAKRAKSVCKTTKRDFWVQKGNGLSG
ncbi:poly(A) RNA polymerase protein 1 [Diutina catenulata]